MVHGERADELAVVAGENGASGAEIVSPHEFITYVQDSGVRLDEVLIALRLMGATVRSCLPVEEENWVQRSAAVWSEVTVGDVRLIPVPDASAPSVASDESVVLHLIPGAGFGTGHHASTRLALQLLQHELLRARPPARALDFGTGNGVLALAAAKLYDCRVEAIDVDSDALRNAADNCALNGTAELVTFSPAPLTSVEGPFDLVLGNIYAEVLCAYEKHLWRCSKPSALAVLAGLLAEREFLIDCTFARWPLRVRMVEGEWVAHLRERPREGCD